MGQVAPSHPLGREELEPGISADTATRLSNLRDEDFTNTAGLVLYEMVSKRDMLRAGTIVSKLLDKRGQN